MSDQSDKEELARKILLNGWRQERLRVREEARKKRIAELQKLIKDGCLCIPEGTVRISWAEYANEDLFTSVKIPDSVMEIEEAAFGNDPRLTEVILGSGVRKIAQRAFHDCRSLKTITLPEGLREIECETFKGCASLERVHLPKGLREIGHDAFEGCVSLECINLPDSIEKIDIWAFRRCPKLPRQTVPAGISNLSGRAFDLVPNIPPENTRYSSAGGLLIDRGYILIGADVSLTAATVPEGVYYVEDGAFAGCTSLSTVTFPAGTNMKEMFKGVFPGAVRWFPSRCLKALVKFGTFSSRVALHCRP